MIKAKTIFLDLKVYEKKESTKQKEEVEEKRNLLNKKIVVQKQCGLLSKLLEESRRKIRG
jgi:hypothetical protein